MIQQIPEISVIIPVYNVERFLRQCVDSVLTQTYTNLEIILVDDGSPDGCGRICDEYVKKDKRVKVIHKQNGGLSDARNAGMDIATGEYLLFIDSDDWIENDTIELLYGNMSRSNADISTCLYYNAYLNCVVPHCTDAEILVLNTEQAIEKCFTNKKSTVSAWGKLYRKSIFDNLRYPYGKYCEDSFIIVDVLSKASVIVVDTAPKFYYRQRKSSIIHDVFSPKTLDVIEAFERNLRIIEETYTGIIDTAKARLLSVTLDVFQLMIFSPDYKRIPDYRKVLHTLRENYGFIMKSAFFTRNIKIKVKALRISVNLYKILQSLNVWKKKRLTAKDRILFE